MVNIPKNIDITNDASGAIEATLDALKPDKVMCLVDENTKEHCLPKITQNFELIEIKSGELNKTLSTCETIWKGLTDYGCSRKSLLINFGGGVIGDMGGFCASTFKRGINFINIPTTLLSQVDASIGGKLGIDFNGLKNHIGVFRQPDKVIVNTEFTSTLPEREKLSGFAEVIKHALIFDGNHWDYLRPKSFDEIDLDYIVPISIEIKNKVVEEDPLERGLRKILNFGHTLGHAIETYFLESSTPLLHGEAIAIGMILEGQLSVEKTGLKQREFEDLRNYILKTYTNLPSSLPNIDKLMTNLLQDKKNEQGVIKFSLLKSIGSCDFNIEVDYNLLNSVISSYNSNK